MTSVNELREIWLKAANDKPELMKRAEVTVPTFGEGEEFEELQAEILKTLYTVWFSHPAVDTIVYWNQIEGYCYVDEGRWNENNCLGGLFHHDLTPKKSALMLKKLITEDWHTEESLTTDENGCVKFCGFYGSYEIEADGKNIPPHLTRRVTTTLF
jgi:hypothetical protein